MKDQKKCPEPKWFALVNDSKTDAPQQSVEESVIRVQTGIPNDHVLVQDMNSPNDPVIPP